MAEEHDYQRSGKKCKEKLDNMYKYYKKTKGMNIGRKDGRNYRFFKQLEALYGENSANTIIHQAQENQEVILTDHKLTSSEEDSDEEKGSESNETDKEDGWTSKIRDLIEMQMKKLMEMQESWFEKMLHAMQSMEKIRASREEAWRKQELAQSEREERVWASEKAWIEARNAEIINALEKIICKCRASNEEESAFIETCDDHQDEIANLIRLQSRMQPGIEFDDDNGLIG